MTNRNEPDAFQIYAGVSSLNSPRILHVEDDAAAALLVKIALSEVVPALSCHRSSSVDDALMFLFADPEGALSSCLDLILLDLNLPPKSGFEVLAAVRGAKSFDHVPIVVFTSSAAPADHDRSIALGANAFIRKPSSFDDYVQTLRELVRLIPGEQG